MEFLLDPAVWVFISFLIFAKIAFRFGRAALIDKLDSRIAEIRKEIETAESLRVEAQELLAQYQRKQRDASKEADAIIETAEKHAAAIKKKAETELDELMSRRERQLEERLHRMEQVARRDIQTYAAALTAKATAEIIAEKMDKKDKARLVDEAISEFPSQFH